MKKTIKAIIVLFVIVTGGIAKADVYTPQCQTIYNYQTGQYTKICCTPQGGCTVFSF